MNPEEIISNFKSGCGFGLTNGPGVYAIYLTRREDIMRRITPQPQRLVYIGSSKNVHKRVYSPNHVFRKLFDRQEKSGLIVFALDYETEDYLNIEKQLIDHFKPYLNKNHK